MTIEIVVVKTPKGYLVRPAYAAIRPGDMLVWLNCTHRPIQVFVPRATPGARTLREYGDRGEARMRIPERAKTGFHPYAVYSEEANDFCIGESGPGVIIKR